MEDLARRCAELTDRVEKRKLARARSEAHVESAKERLTEAMAEARSAGFSSMKDMESARDGLAAEIETMLTKCEELV